MASYKIKNQKQDMLKYDNISIKKSEIVESIIFFFPIYLTTP